MIAALICGRADGAHFAARNTFPLLGRPLMVYPGLAAQHSTEVDAVFLSSDDEPMKQIARHVNLLTIDRPPELSGPAVPLREVVRHGRREIERTIGSGLEALVVLLANAPTV